MEEFHLASWRYLFLHGKVSAGVPARDDDCFHESVSKVALDIKWLTNHLGSRCKHYSTSECYLA